MVAAKPHSIPTSEVLANARAAQAELARQIDHQAQDAAAGDTKAAALMAITAGITGLIAPRVHFDEPARVVAGVFALIVVVVLMTCCAQALRPRQGFHYGPDASHLLDLLDTYSEVQVALSMADSFTEARNLNVAYLATKQDWYQRALRSLFLVVAAIVVMIGSGGIQ